MLTVTWICFSPAFGQSSTKTRQGNRIDSSAYAKYYLHLTKQAFKHNQYVQVLNYYEMARSCDDFLQLGDTTNWIEKVRAAQEDEVRAREGTINELKATNRKIRATQLALQAIKSEDPGLKKIYALQSFDEIKMDGSSNKFSSTETLQALREAYKLSRRPPKGIAGLELLQQVNDSTAITVTKDGSVSLIHLDEDTCYAERKITELKFLNARDISCRPADDIYAFGGFSPRAKNRLVISNKGAVSTYILLPGTNAVYAVTLFGNDMIFGGYDNAIHQYSTKEKKHTRHSLLNPGEKISCLKTYGSNVYIGTNTGSLAVWTPGTNKINRLSAGEGTLMSKLVVLDETHIIAGFADGNVRTLRGSEEKRYRSNHRDFIQELIACPEEDILIKMSIDGYLSISHLDPDLNDPPITVRYNPNNMPVGIVYSREYQRAIVFLANGTLDIVHLDLNYYAQQLIGQP